MIRLLSKYSIIGFAAAAVLASLAGAATETRIVITDSGQTVILNPPQTPDVPGDKPFMTEMHLSPDGVYGLDSAGNEWDYDFSRDTFVTKEKGKTSTVTVFGSNRGQSDTKVTLGPQGGEIPDSEVTVTTYNGLIVGSVHVRSDEKVKGSITAMGPVTVEGTVTGNVTSYSKITISDEGKILGDARAPQIIKMRGGRIYGDRSETDIPELPGISLFSKSSNTQLIVNTIILCSLLFCTLILVTVAPRPIDRIKTCLRTCFVKSFFTGLLVWILIGPVIALLCLTIIGIPVGVIVIPLALAGAFLMGVIGFSQLIGGTFGRIKVDSKGTQLLAALIGLIIYSMPWLLAGFLQMMGSPFFDGFATFFNVISIIVWSIGITAGIGAVFMTRFGNRDCRKILLQRINQDWASMRPAPPPPTPPPLKSDG